MQDWFAVHDSDRDSGHFVTDRVVAELHDSSKYCVLTDPIATRSARLRAALSPEIWRVVLDLMDAMMDRAALEAAAHYNHGVEAGRDMRLEDDFVRNEPTRALRTIARALVRVGEAVDAAFKV